LFPLSRLAVAILFLAGTEAVLLVLQGLLRLVSLTRAADALAGWTVFLGWTLGILLLVRGLRWLRDHVMWSVRNRLIVTYLFIGGGAGTPPLSIWLLLAF